MNQNFLIFVLLFLAILIFAEVLYRRVGISPEVSRRCAHILGGLGVFLLPDFLGFESAVLLGLLFSIFLFTTGKLGVLPSINKVRRKTYGTPLFPLGLLISALLFWETSLVSFKVSVLVLAVSDSLAGLVGYKYGRTLIREGFGKTWEGSLAFLSCTFLIFIVALMFISQISIVTLSLALFFSLILTLIEVFAAKGFDNLCLPPASAFLFSLIL